MSLSEFDYVLPPDAVARHPTPDRDGSRLMRLGRRTGDVTHHVFRELPDLLRAGDLLVVNDSRVRAARLFAQKTTGGRVELLLVEPEERYWLALAQGSKALKPGTTLSVGDSTLTVIERREGGWIVVDVPDADHLTETHGRLPLPPYMNRDPEASDRERYQTIFSRADRVGSVAAPTAGLHFTDGLMARLGEMGIHSTTITLHVGPGTFLPVRTDDLEAHQMHAERFALSEPAAAAIAKTRADGGRIVAVGTTVTRVLESVDDPTVPVEGSTDLFIRPGFEFRHVDALITNFHLPKSTLLMLVCAYAGRRPVLAAYEEAVRQGYRFYSYGDAMLIH